MYGAIIAGVQLWTMLFCQNPSQNVLGSKIFYIILTKFDYVYMQLYINKVCYVVIFSSATSFGGLVYTFQCTILQRQSLG